jgi:saccharopine dehydrogenase-like NADP-dependent oxidoreductase
MKGNILIVGGYGGVGRVISTTLGDRFPGQVVVAGRNYQKAQDFASKTNNKVIPAKLDISRMDEVGSSLDDNVALVVMCVENQDTQFVEQCINRGIHYVDISATYELLSQIEPLDSKAQKHGSTVILSVGLAPGLTNLLASHCTSVLDEVLHVDIFLLLGMGEVHGESSNQWLLDNLNSEYGVRQSGVEKRVQTFGEFKQTVFPGGAGKRSAFRFNFSDQHTVVRTLGVDSASTWACFDSAFFTWFFYFEKKLGLFNLLRFETMKRMYLKLLGSIHIGSDLFIAQVVANGTVDGKSTSYTCSVSGHGEGRMTGLVAAKVAKHLYTSTAPAGVLHIEQLFDQPRVFIEELSKREATLQYRF